MGFTPVIERKCGNGNIETTRVECDSPPGIADSPAHIYRRIHNGEIPGPAGTDGTLKFVPQHFVEWLKKEIAKGCGVRKRTRKPSNDGQAMKNNKEISNEVNHQPENAKSSAHPSNELDGNDEGESGEMIA